MDGSYRELANLILASEDYDEEQFLKHHHFLKYEEDIIRKLMAHGPVLLKGGRGTGKSALMLEAYRRLKSNLKVSNAFGIYISMRHLPLLRATGSTYEKELLRILVDKIKDEVKKAFELDFYSDFEVYEVHRELLKLSEQIDKRIVIFFDDAAHIGREAGLEEFFDVFRTLSSKYVSCKAAIYPGVTKFGDRFDIYHDATVIEINRREDQRGYNELFKSIMQSRFPESIEHANFSSGFTLDSVSRFLARSVIGNVRSFIKASEYLFTNQGTSIGYGVLSETLLTLSQDFYWPMIEELQLKLGNYEVLIDSSQDVANILFDKCADKGATSCIVNRKIVAHLGKSLEILEYAGFISRREVSRGMKSGGRGTRYALNLCNLLEATRGSRLTRELYKDWTFNTIEDVQFSSSSELLNIQIPTIPHDYGLKILELPIDKLKKSNVFPYGITDHKLELLQNDNIFTVRDLAEATDERILSIKNIGYETLKRLRSVLGQAIWM